MVSFMVLLRFLVLFLLSSQCFLLQLLQLLLLMLELLFLSFFVNFTLSCFYFSSTWSVCFFFFVGEGRGVEGLVAKKQC